MNPARITHEADETPPANDNPPRPDIVQIMMELARGHTRANVSRRHRLSNHGFMRTIKEQAPELVASPWGKSKQDQQEIKEAARCWLFTKGYRYD